jgi:hypothetical protein
MWIRGAFGLPFAIGMLACSMIFSPLQQAYASSIQLTARPATTDIVNWGQLGTPPSLTFTTPQNFTSSSGDILGTVYFNGTLTLVQECCIGDTGNFDGDFAPGDLVIVTSLGTPLSIKSYEPVQAVGAQIQDNKIGDHFTAVILAFNGDTLLATFTAAGYSGEAGDNSNVFLGVQDSTADITEIVYLIVDSDPSTPQNVAINQLSVVPGPKHKGTGK